MNLKKNQQLTKASIVAATVGLAALVGVSANGETLVGLTWGGAGSGSIIQFDSATPGVLTSSVGITGAGGDAFVGIDYYGNTLYGVSAGGALYTINPNDGAATLVPDFGTISGTYFGVENETGGVRVTSDLDINVLVDRTTGALISSTPALTPSGLSLNGLAFSGGTMYAVDSIANSLGILNTGLGTWVSIGSMGYDVSGKNGFDISQGTGIAYFASGVSSSGLDANLYIVDLSTGLAGLVGVIGPGEGLLVYGLTAAVPEPTSGALVLLGAGLVALARRRK